MTWFPFHAFSPTRCFTQSPSIQFVRICKQKYPYLETMTAKDQGITLMDSVFGRPGALPGPRGTRGEMEGPRAAPSAGPTHAILQALSQRRSSKPVTLTWRRDGIADLPSRHWTHPHLRASHSLRCLLFRVRSAIS